MTAHRQDRRGKRRRRSVFLRAAALGGLAVLGLLLFTLLHACESGTPEGPEHSGRQAETTREEPAPDQSGEGAPSPSRDLPEGWERIRLPETARAEGNLILVSASHPFDAAGADTVSVYEHKNGSYLVKNIYLSVTPETVEALNAWMKAFAAETGVRDVNVVAGWRSYDDQAALYDNAVAEKGQAHADAYIALPGRSEHHTGLAVDLDTYNVETGTSGGFDGGGAYAWAVEHAWEYGFIQRYPPSKSAVTGIAFEAWHFRYVGLPHAFVMAREDLCLEEYLDLLRGYPFSGEHLRVSCLGADYEIYFCPEDDIVVPTLGSYTVSGNNVDGYIVTVMR